MWSVILEFLMQNWAMLAIVIIAGYCAGYFTRRFTKWEVKHNVSHEKMNEKVQKTEDALDKILYRLDTIERFLIKNGGANYDEFTIMKSPRQLNDKGIMLFKDSGSEDFFIAKREALLRLLDMELSKVKHVTALDVEICANRVCLEISGNDEFRPIKDFIYTHPKYEGTNINIETIAFLMGIELRNAYLKLHPEIDPMN